MRVWIDIENAPQVQYLLPVRSAFEAAGADTVVTARDCGDTLAMLEDADVPAHVFGSRAGKAKLRKVGATAVRARDLWRFFSSQDHPDALVAASRPAAVAARRLGIPNFLIHDYEYIYLRMYRATGSIILHPDVIDPAVFCRRGLRSDQLIGFGGLKEDLTFADVDLDAIDPHDLGAVPEDAVRVLFRPPAETSHYYREASTTMARATLLRLAQSDAVVVYSPREPEQVSYLDGLPWRYPPIVLDRPVPFVSLLKSVDAVISAGGTMLREAAYLGVPAYSIFQSQIGGVDRWLERLGRIRILAGPEDLSQLELERRGPLQRLDSNPGLLDDLVGLIGSRLDRLGPLSVPRSPSLVA
ncbi:MAG: DUF354 domain-containing protein [Solirubrobacteraceae bacterium]